MYEASAGHRFGAGLVTVLLAFALAAGAVTYLVVRQALADDVVDPPGAAGPNSTTSGPGRTSTSDGNSNSPPGRSTPSPPIGTQPADQAVTGDACPAATVNAVKIAGRPGGLKRLFYVEGSQEGTVGARVWICQDTDGSLYYQGYNPGQPFAASESQVTLLLGPGIKGSVAAAGQGYRAVNPTTDGETQYIVTREVLTVISPNNGRTEYTVTRYAPT